MSSGGKIDAAPVSETASKVSIAPAQGPESPAVEGEDPRVAVIRDSTAKVLESKGCSQMSWPPSNSGVALGRSIMKILGFADGEYRDLIYRRKIIETDIYKSLPPKLQIAITAALDVVNGGKP